MELFFVKYIFVFNELLNLDTNGCDWVGALRAAKRPIEFGIVQRDEENRALVDASHNVYRHRHERGSLFLSPNYLRIH